MTTNGSPFLLGPIGAEPFGLTGPMHPIDATPGVSVSVARPRGESLSGAGVRRSRRGRYAPRTWEVSLDEVTPEALTVLDLAAQGLLGDMWLLDRAAAAANMLWPWQVASEDTQRERVAVDGVRLPSLTVGGTMNRVMRVRPSATASVDPSSPDSNASSGSRLAVPLNGAALMRFDVPELPPGSTFLSATLVLSRDGGPQASGSFDVRETIGEWRESLVTWASRPDLDAFSSLDLYSNSVPFEPVESLELLTNRPATFPGRPVGLALVSTGGVDSLLSRRDTLGRAPELLIRYQQVTPVEDAPAARVILRADQLYTISVWTSAPFLAPRTLLEWAFTSDFRTTSGVVTATDDAPRAHSTTLTPSEDGVLTVRPVASTLNVSGMRVHEGPPDGRFYAGRGTPCRVAVADPQGALTRWREGELGTGSYTVQLIEVGVPGEVAWLA